MNQKNKGLSIENQKRPKDEKTCDFDEVAAFLAYYVKGLGGSTCKLDTNEIFYSDSQTIYLPETLSIESSKELNKKLFQIIASHLWAQNFYETWNHRVLSKIEEAQDNQEQLLKIFYRLECIRLDFCLARDLPGLWRQYHPFRSNDKQNIKIWNDWKNNCEVLSDKHSSSFTSFSLISNFLNHPLPKLEIFQQEFQIHNLSEILNNRAADQREDFRASLQKLLDEKLEENNCTSAAEDKIEFDNEANNETNGDSKYELSVNGEKIEISQNLSESIGAIIKDLGFLPEEYLKPNSNGRYTDQLSNQNHEEEQTSSKKSIKTFFYDEWDCTTQSYKKSFCELNEVDIIEGDDTFTKDTLEKYKNNLRSIKKTFEAIIEENSIQKKQIDGDQLDYNAIIETMPDLLMGNELSEHLYARYQTKERNIAVMFMVDMSGSTLGWVNDAERESLVLLCEALSLLGDRYAIYGFSGRTNKKCEVYKIKEFDQPYNYSVKGRISGIRPKAYTRMGVAIRHLGKKLQNTCAKTKLLVTLSDGRPEDYGGYKGTYGIEDTRKALLEIKRQGINPFCVTIDNEAQEYLPRMYGKINYTVIDDVKKLPYKVADIYRKLTC